MSRSNAILVVEGDEAIADLIADVLGDEGYTIRVALDAVSALASARSTMPDLILADLRATGFRFIDELRSSGAADVPFVMITTNERGQRLELHGVASCLIKPFDLDDLLDCVAKHITRKQE